MFLSCPVLGDPGADSGAKESWNGLTKKWAKKSQLFFAHFFVRPFQLSLAHCLPWVSEDGVVLTPHSNSKRNSGSRSLQFLDLAGYIFATTAHVPHNIESGESGPLQSRPQSPRAFTVSGIEMPTGLWDNRTVSDNRQSGDSRDNQKPDATFEASGFLKRMCGRF